MEKEIITTEKAPQAIGPYSQAVKVGNLLYTSGQIPLSPVNGSLIEGGVAEQTKQVLENLQAVLIAAGTSMDKVIKTTVFLKNMENFNIVNEIYAQYFTSNYPARSCVQVVKLPKDVEVEIEVIALVE